MFSNTYNQLDLYLILYSSLTIIGLFIIKMVYIIRNLKEAKVRERRRSIKIVKGEK